MTPLAPWQQRVYAQAASALQAGRLGHGLLLCGPAQLGKRAVAERLAQHLLCNAPDGGEPCGRCRSCALFAARIQRDPAEVRPDGSLAHPAGHPSHPDAHFVGFEWNEKARPPKPRTEITIDQVRELSAQLVLTPQLGNAVVGLVDPAEAINHAASNALLKTLEEPVPGRYLLLLSAAPARLSATIRSRCQRLEFRLPPREEASAWLLAQGHDARSAGEALEAARGHPGLADAWLREGGLALRREVEADLRRLGQGEASALDVAQAWGAAEDLDARLRHAADLALGMASAGLTDPARTRRLAAWFDAANRVREQLRTTVRADLALVELLLAWQGGDRNKKTHGGRA